MTSSSVCRENDGCCCGCLWVGSLFLIHKPSPVSFSRMWQRTQPCGMTRVQHLHAQPFQTITWDRRLKQLDRAYLHACHHHSPSLPLSENSSWEMKTSRFLRGRRTHLNVAPLRHVLNAPGGSVFLFLCPISSNSTRSISWVHQHSPQYVPINTLVWCIIKVFWVALDCELHGYVKYMDGKDCCLTFSKEKQNGSQKEVMQHKCFGDSSQRPEEVY